MLFTATTKRTTSRPKERARERERKRKSSLQKTNSQNLDKTTKKTRKKKLFSFLFFFFFLSLSHRAPPRPQLRQRRPLQRHGQAHGRGPARLQPQQVLQRRGGPRVRRDRPDPAASEDGPGGARRGAEGGGVGEREAGGRAEKGRWVLSSFGFFFFLLYRLDCFLSCSSSFAAFFAGVWGRGGEGEKSPVLKKKIIPKKF